MCLRTLRTYDVVSSTPVSSTISNANELRYHFKKLSRISIDILVSGTFDAINRRSLFSVQDNFNRRSSLCDFRPTAHECKHREGRKECNDDNVITLRNSADLGSWQFFEIRKF